MKFLITRRMLKLDFGSLRGFGWSDFPVLKGILQTLSVGLVVILVARYATADSVSPTMIDQNEIESICKSNLCDKASEVILGISNFLGAVSLSIIGGFIFLIKNPTRLSNLLRVSVCISGITLALITIYIHYLLTVELAMQLFLGKLKLNIINERLIWEAGFVYLATLALVFLALTANWDISDGKK